MAKNGTGCLAAMLIGVPIIILLLLFGIYFYRSYNKIVEANQVVEKSWANVHNVYQKRSDLIPNLVATVKGYAEHESGTFTAVSEARSSASSINLTADELNEETLAKFEQAQATFSNTISRLLAIRENYPELKADAHFTDLMNQLNDVEAEIVDLRNAFNEDVQSYNVLIMKFPRNIVASISGFKQKSYFTASTEAQSAPKVEF